MTLDELFDQVVGIETDPSRPADPDNDLPTLHVIGARNDQDGEPLEETPAGGRMIFGLAVEGSGREIAAAARLFIVNTDPTAAVLVLPSWGAILPTGQSLATYGVTQVRDLPPDMIQDMLVFLGEDETGVWHPPVTYVCERNADGQRVWVKQPDGDHTSTHFQPLFVADAMLARVRAAVPYLNTLAQDMGLDAEAQRYHERRAVARILREQVMSGTRP